MVARELQHAPRDPRGFLRGLSEPWAIPRTVYGGSATPTPLRPTARTALLALRDGHRSSATRASWRSHSSGLELLRVGFGRKLKKEKPQRPAGEWLCSSQATFSCNHLMLGYNCSCGLVRCMGRATDPHQSVGSRILHRSSQDLHLHPAMATTLTNRAHP